MTSQSRQVLDIVGQIKPILAHRSPDMQGAVLAELLALWLAGHQLVGDEEETAALRERLLLWHMDAVRQLTIVNARIIEANGSRN